MHLERDPICDVLEDKAWSSVKNGTSKRLAKRWDHRLSNESLSQQVSPLKDSAKTVNPSATIPLGTGRPTSLYYPWQSMSMTGTDESRQTQARRPTGSMTCTKGESAFDLSSALNYAEPSGWSQLVSWFRERTGRIHNPLYRDWDTTLTCGSTSALDVVLRMFCNRGDWILTEAFTYPGTLLAAKAQGLRALGIEMDDDGPVPSALDAALRDWDASRGRKPFVLYTVPTGQNPTGVTQSAARKHAIYRVAERHDLLILEDDPYFFLRLNEPPPSSPPPSSSSSSSSSPCLLDTFRGSLPTSYLSLDRAGRVVRVESTSKILAPGLRCGWLTASRQVVDVFANFAEVGPSTPSGPSQVMLYKLLVEAWGEAGFVGWLDHLSAEYGRRRDVILAACARHLPGAVCSWTTPTHGMFVWIRVALERHADRGAVEEAISARAEGHGVLVARGSWFDVKGCANVFFRMTFVATASEGHLERGVEQFGRAVREEFGLSGGE